MCVLKFDIFWNFFELVNCFIYIFLYNNGEGEVIWIVVDKIFLGFWNGNILNRMGVVVFSLKVNRFIL